MAAEKMNKIQLAIVNNEALTDVDVLDAVDGVLIELNSTGDINKADSTLQILNRIENVSGLAKAKLLSGMYSWWKDATKSENNNELKDQDFFDHIKLKDHQKRTYAERLMRVWDYQNQLPESIKNWPIKDIIPITNTLAQGYEITNKQWKTLEKSASSGDIASEIRIIKNNSPRKSSMQIVMESDGTLNVWKDNQAHFVGYLDIKEIENDLVVAKAIDRIVDNSGITRK